MEAPLGILFLKKIELYDQIRDLRDKAKFMEKQHPNSRNPITWYVEEKILKWTFHGHKYLLGPIKKSDFNIKNSTKLGDWELLDRSKMIDLLVENKIIDKNKSLKEDKLISKTQLLFKKFEEKIEEGNLRKDEIKKKQEEIKERHNEIVKKKYRQAVKQPDSIFKNMVAREFARYEDSSSKDSIIINKRGLDLGEVIYRAGKSKYIKGSYIFFGWLMNSGGAWFLLILFIFTIVASIISLFKIF